MRRGLPFLKRVTFMCWTAVSTARSSTIVPMARVFEPGESMATRTFMILLAGGGSMTREAWCYQRMRCFWQIISCCKSFARNTALNGLFLGRFAREFVFFWGLSFFAMEVLRRYVHVILDWHLPEVICDNVLDYLNELLSPAGNIGLSVGPVQMKTDITHLIGFGSSSVRISDRPRFTFTIPFPHSALRILATIDCATKTKREKQACLWLAIYVGAEKFQKPAIPTASLCLDMSGPQYFGTSIIVSDERKKAFTPLVVTALSKFDMEGSLTLNIEHY